MRRMTAERRGHEAPWRSHQTPAAKTRTSDATSALDAAVLRRARGLGTGRDGIRFISGGADGRRCFGTESTQSAGTPWRNGRPADGSASSVTAPRRRKSRGRCCVSSRRRTVTSESERDVILAAGRLSWRAIWTGEAKSPRRSKSGLRCCCRSAFGLHMMTSVAGLHAHSRFNDWAGWLVRQVEPCQTA